MAKKFNLKIRFQNKTFIVGLISALIILAQQIGHLFGFEIDEVLSEQIQNIVNTVLGILVMLGVVHDPTTKGVVDSERALGYDELG